MERIDIRPGQKYLAGKDDGLLQVSAEYPWRMYAATLEFDGTTGLVNDDEPVNADYSALLYDEKDGGQCIQVVVNDGDLDAVLIGVTGPADCPIAPRIRVLIGTTVIVVPGERPLLVERTEEGPLFSIDNGPYSPSGEPTLYRVPPTLWGRGEVGDIAIDW